MLIIKLSISRITHGAFVNDNHLLPFCT